MLFEFSEVIVPCVPKSSHSCRPVAGIYLSYSLLRKTRWIPAKDREDDTMSRDPKLYEVSEPELLRMRFMVLQNEKMGTDLCFFSTQFCLRSRD